MNIFKQYTNFIDRQHHHPSSNTKLIDIYPSFYTNCILCSLFFISLNLILPVVISVLYPSFYRSLNKRKRRELPTYSSCLFHHFIVTPLGLYSIYKDIFRTSIDLDNHDYIVSEGYIVPYCFGYLVGDTLFLAIQECIDGKPSFLFHHILAFGLVYYVTIAPGQILRFIPYLTICEFSSIFFAIGWFYKCAGLSNHTINIACNVLFALTFFLFRVVNLPIMLWALCERAELKGSLLSYIVIPCIGLQLFWFWKIIAYIIFPRKEIKIT